VIRRVMLVLGLVAGSVAAVAAVGVAAVGVAAAAPAPKGPEIIAVTMRGESPNVSTDPLRQAFEFDLYSVATGEKIGTATDDVACKTDSLPGCPLIDAITTFHLADGDIVNRATVAIAPDPARPGYVLNGSFPDGDTIVSGTGAYADRTGRARLSGANNIVGFPQKLTTDDIFVIELDR
jgi:hypothetical protein